MTLLIKTLLIFLIIGLTAFWVYKIFQGGNNARK